MKALKKILSIILAMIGAVIGIIVILCLFFLLIEYIDQGYIGNNDPKKGYYNKEEYFEENAFMDYTDYCKYYYKEEYDEKFAKDKKYSEVKEEDIPEVLKYFDEFEGWMLPERANEYDFDKTQITPGDYVRIESQGVNVSFDVYLYDVETHILYYIHNNN